MGPGNQDLIDPTASRSTLPLIDPQKRAKSGWLLAVAREPLLHARMPCDIAERRPHGQHAS
ncbi:MAG TPA: hypothetical protein VEJ20_10500 [Candidatus Eremiobacteraceae bacterium]|nr:hypothetical protein [Candidatus Eremiobacteraceae bacterium]